MQKSYDLIIANDPAELIEIANEAIKQGYSPLGGLVIVQDKLVQAIVLIQKKEIKIKEEIDRTR